MLSSIFMFVVGVLWIYWLYTRYQKIWKHLARYPGPTALPLVGNLLQVGRGPEEYFTSMRRWNKQYDFKPFRLYAGPQPYVVFSSAKHIESILSSTTLLHKADIYVYMHPWLGQGLLTSNGQYWAKHRKMITPSFHFQILQDFLRTINETTSRFKDLLGTYAKTEQIIDFQELVTRSTLDIICECAMGYRLNSIQGSTSPIVKAINDMCYVIPERLFNPIKRWNFFFQFTSDHRLHEQALKVLHQELTKIIGARRKFLEKQGNQSLNIHDHEYKRPKMAFLDNLLTARIDGKPLTFREIFEEVNTFIFAGHDTTASALAFGTYCLSRHPEIQQRAFDEQLEMFGTDLERQPTYKELADMNYLDLVIKETLRMFPSVPMIGRTTTTLTTIDGHVVPPDTTLLLPVIGVAYDEQNFDRPFEFMPERFLPDRREHANPFDNVPFSAGPRNCIGQKFAMMELKSTLSMLLRNFVILPPVDGLSSGIPNPHDQSGPTPSPYDIRLACLITLKSVNGVHIRLRPRVY